MVMAFIEIKNLNFRYPGEKKKALSDINLSIEQGEFLVLCGPSGSGKTTLLRHLKKELFPAGDRTGSSYYEGEPFSALQDKKSAQEIGMVFQNPENQMVMDTVIHELVFSLENFGYPSNVIKKKIAEMVTFFGLEDSLHKSIHELSGGLKQKINLASVVVLQPKLLLLDEPTSQLDPVAAQELLKMVYKLNQEFSITVLMSEHRLEEVFPMADRIIYMREGCIMYNTTPRGMSRRIMKKKDFESMEFLPSIVRLFFSMNHEEKDSKKEEIPLTVREGKRFIKNKIECRKGDSSSIIKDDKNRERLLACKGVYFRYNKEKPFILKNLDFSIEKGDFYAIFGGNSAGKTTLLQVLAGLLEPQRGSVYFEKRKLKHLEDKEKYSKIGYVAQNPLLHFTFDTVQEELQFIAQRLEPIQREEKMKQMIECFEMKNMLLKHPYDCSGGQQQKLALACALLPDPEILLMDEPTKGLDPLSKNSFAKLLGNLRKTGLTIVMATHDIEFAANYVEQCTMLFQGAIISCAPPKEFFHENYFYTTVINRIVKEELPYAITYRDVMEACSIQDCF